jgi:formate dehydrogenase major subunit
MTNGVDEIADADVVFVFGYNGADSHPIVARQIVMAKENGAKIICADPRIIETARIADIHLQLKGGTNLLLANALCHTIVEEGLTDSSFIAEHSSGFEDFKKTIMDDKYAPEAVEAQTQVPASDIRKAARMYAASKKSMILYGMGVCQFGQAVDVVKTLADLCILTGNLGHRCTGIGPVRGQNNVQGACDMGALPNTYPGYQSVTDPKIHEKFEKAWRAKLSDKAGYPLSQVPQHVIGLKDDDPKKLHAYYIMGEDPAQSDPDLGEVREALEKIDFVILQDIYMNKTGQYADVILPSTGWCEHDAIYTCCDRGFQKARKIIEPKGDVKTDWEIICAISTAMGYKMHYKEVGEIWDELIELVPNYAGATRAKIEKYVNVQWPCKSKDDSDRGTGFMHKGGNCSSADHKAKFFATDWRPPQEVENKDYPLSLCTVREVGHYSVRTMSGNCRMLRSLEDEPGWVEMSPRDAEPLGIAHGDIIRISSKRGSVLSRAKVTERVKKGAVYMTYQWWVGACNELTNAALDPVSNTPEYKYCACKVEALKDQKAAWAEVRSRYETLREQMRCDKKEVSA